MIVIYLSYPFFFTLISTFGHVDCSTYVFLVSSGNAADHPQEMNDLDLNDQKRASQVCMIVSSLCYPVVFTLMTTYWLVDCSTYVLLVLSDNAVDHPQERNDLDLNIQKRTAFGCTDLCWVAKLM